MPVSDHAAPLHGPIIEQTDIAANTGMVASQLRRIYSIAIFSRRQFAGEENEMADERSPRAIPVLDPGRGRTKTGRP